MNLISISSGMLGYMNGCTGLRNARDHLPLDNLAFPFPPVFARTMVAVFVGVFVVARFVRTPRLKAARDSYEQWRAVVDGATRIKLGMETGR